MLELTVDHGETKYLPGESVPAELRWSFPAPCERIEVCLLWRTSGKGTEDEHVVWDEVIQSVGSTGRRQFNMPLPLAPYSFSGKLITLNWFIEAFAEPDGDSTSLLLTVGPRRRELFLSELRPGRRDW